MGLLSSLLTIGGTIAGSFVGAPSIGASIGGALGGALDQSSASSAASKAQEAAYERAIALRQQAAQQITQVQQPYNDFGTSSINALTGRLGLSAPTPIGTQTAGSVSPPVTGSNALTGAPVGSQPVKSGMVVDPAPGPNGSMTAVAPQTVQTGGATPVATGGAPVASGVDPGTYGSTANPTEPGKFSYTAADYTASPAYAYQQDQARRQTIAGAAATGALQSGAAMKELQDRAENIAYGDFANERQFAAGRADQDRANYADDRNYLTNRFDTQTNNLFKGVGVGQQAAGVVSNADLNVANGNAQSATGVGQAQAANDLTQGQIGSNFATGLGGVLSSAIKPQVNALTGMPLQTTPNLSTLPVQTSASFVNPLPSFAY